MSIPVGELVYRVTVCGVEIDNYLFSEIVKKIKSSLHRAPLHLETLPHWQSSLSLARFQAKLGLLR